MNPKLACLALIVCGLSAHSRADAACQGPAEKSSLEVLFVGHDPANPYINYNPTPAMVEYHRERTGAFRAFLEEHFARVQVVHAGDYRPVLSQSVDVTIFDAKPPVLPSATDEQKELRAAPFLPADFSRPVLMIGEVSADIGGPIGLKLDWL